MEFTKVLNGDNTTFGASTFAKSVVLNQVLFDLNRALKQKEREVPVMDARIEAELGIATPSSTPVKLNAEELTDAAAAAYILLFRAISKNDPETGRRPEQYRKWLREPKQYVDASTVRFEKLVLEQRKAQEMATAKQLGADPTARLKVIEDEVKALVAFDCPTWVQDRFVDSIKAQKDHDDSELIDDVCDAMVTAGRDVSKEIKKACQVFIDAQKRRYEGGGFVTIDSGIYALAQM